ncbi:hypothetical protein [Gynuella sunshinyii]|uniref:Uncharacterized protein n=1 Tax=Gynuella sunshinyii YC6258 TaxID=1445510 RepID=A0A0C5VUK5_9GAMM|nr:hypothetical protein [Gynuella sunshinyii]AJQ96988.1 hypothetical Protein YC6258_04956 [Gynuella sunshinyii YC6258]
MKLIKLWLSLLAISSAAAAVEQTSQTIITKIESRDVNIHDIYFEADIPSQGCAYNDRALIDVSTAGVKAMMSVALSALTTGKPVVLKVDGCLGYAPKAVTLILYK